MVAFQKRSFVGVNRRDPCWHHNFLPQDLKNSSQSQDPENSWEKPVYGTAISANFPVPHPLQCSMATNGRDSQAGIPFMPTPAEIEQRAAAIRATWSDRERSVRADPRERRRRWKLPVVADELLAIDDPVPVEEWAAV